jgi:hypothetical protein
MAKQPHRLSQGPSGQSIGAESSMIDSETNGETLIAEIGIKAGKHGRTHHPFINNSATAQGAKINRMGSRTPQLPDPIPDPAPQSEQQRF